MAREKFEQLKDLDYAIEELEEAISHLENTDYKYIYISGMCDDGVSDRIITSKDDGTDGLVDCILTLLTKRLNDMKKKFEEA